MPVALSQLGLGFSHITPTFFALNIPTKPRFRPSWLVCLCCTSPILSKKSVLVVFDNIPRRNPLLDAAKELFR